jgi:hypothetical protein
MELKFLADVIAGAAKAVPTDEMVAEFPLESGDKLVCVLPSILKRLYAYYVGHVDAMKAERHKMSVRYRKAIAENIMQNNVAAINAVADQVNNRSLVLQERCDLLCDIFFAEVRAAFPELKDEDVIAIREGWKVVIVNGEDIDDDADLELSSVGGTDPDDLNGG